MASVLVRCAIVVIALTAVAWLVVGFRAARLESDAAATLRDAKGGEIPANKVKAARSALQTARRLNADKDPLILDGFLLAATDQSAHGAAQAERVVAEEPDSLEGWRLLYLFSTERDRERAAEAARRMRALNPHMDEYLR